MEQLLRWGAQGWGDELFFATLMTVAISLSSYCLGLVFGCIGAMLKLAPNKLANMAGGLYTTVFRGIPELLIVYLFFFGGNLAVMKVAALFGYTGYIELDVFLVGMLAIGIVAGAYATESIRGGYLSIPKGQIEAGLACGMSRSHLFFRIVFLQALRFALPGLSNLWLINLKSTAILSVIGLVELTRQAGIAAGSTYNFLFFFTVAGVIYAILCSFSTLAIKRIEIWANRGNAGFTSSGLNG